MIKLKVTILVQPGDEEWYMEELESLSRDSEPPVCIIADVTLYIDEGQIDFIFTPEHLTDSIDYVMGHAATLLNGKRLPPKEVE